MKLIIALNKMENDELPDGTIIRATKGFSWIEVIVRKVKNNSEIEFENEFILKMMNLVGLNGEVEVIEPEQKRNKFYIGYDKSNDVDHSALTIIEHDNKGEIVLKRTFYDYDADLLMRIFESKNVLITKEKGE